MDCGFEWESVVLRSVTKGLVFVDNEKKALGFALVDGVH